MLTAGVAARHKKFPQPPDWVACTVSPLLLLPITLFLPALGALWLALDRKGGDDRLRATAIGFSAATFILSLFILNRFDAAIPGIQMAVRVPWIALWHIDFHLGVDGINLPLVILTALVSLLSLLASGGIKDQLKGYLILFLLLETGMLGVFLALDFFLFYVFYELTLLPMFFLIGLWGGPRREYAAIKFFLYTLVGGVSVLVALLVIHFTCGTARSFDLIHLAAVAQGRVAGEAFPASAQLVAFSLLVFGFCIKVPIFPVHTWLPDAHTEAPTPISMILAGVLLKTGAYGLLRVAFPLCPYGAQMAAWPLAALGVASILYGALAALAQTDFKRLVAYSSVSHMGYVVLGLSVWRIVSGETIGRDAWEMGMSGALFQMISHGITSTGMFFLVGVIYDRVHHRDLEQYGGLLARMPEYGGLSIGLFFAAMGLPGLCGFWGEVFPIFAAWNFDPILAVLAALGVIITAAYILWMIRRVYLGAEYHGPHASGLVPLTATETTIGYVLLVSAIILGCFPDLLFGLMRASVSELVNHLVAAGQTLAAPPVAVR